MLVMSIVFVFLNENLKLQCMEFESKAENEQNKFQRILDCLQEGIILISEDNITFMNETCNRIFSELANLKNFFKIQLNQTFKTK